jgi:Tol biopolymer transport system component
MRRCGRLRNLLLLAAVGLVAIAVGAGPAAGTYPGANGRIVFANGTNDLWSVRPDGTGLELLTTVVAPPGSGVRSFVSFPSFSADGSKLAVMLNEFERPTPCDPQAINAGSGACRALVLMNADGSNQHVVYASEDIASLDLALSPDGNKIAFTKVIAKGNGNLSEQLFTIEADGKHLRLLTPQGPHAPATDTAPTWSPDGTMIAFESSRDEALTGNSWSLFSVDVRTRKIGRIIPGSMNNDLEPNWSPDGSKLVFLRTFGYPDYRIYSVNRDGNGEQEILADFTAVQGPVWSPDGSEILYHGLGGLWLVNADGSNSHQLVFGVIQGYSWEPLP